MFWNEGVIRGNEACKKVAGAARKVLKLYEEKKRQAEAHQEVS